MSKSDKKATIVDILPNSTEILQIPILIMPDELPVKWEEL